MDAHVSEASDGLSRLAQDSRSVTHHVADDSLRIRCSIGRAALESGIVHRSAAQESGIGLHCASECSSGMWHRPAPLHPDATAMHCVSSKPLKTQVHVHISLLIQCSTAQKSVQKNSKLTWTPSCFVAAASCTFFSRLLFRLLFVRLLVPDQARGSLHAN